jgi:hypothetical protein
MPSRRTYSKASKLASPRDNCLRGVLEASRLEYAHVERNLDIALALAAGGLRTPDPTTIQSGLLYVDAGEPSSVTKPVLPDIKHYDTVTGISTCGC